MLHVIELDELEVSAFDLEVMGSVVRQVIDQISGNKPGECGREPVGRSKKLHPDEIKEAVKEECQRNTDCRGHDQTCLAHRLFVVNAMEEKCHALHPGCFGRKMKHKSMQEILGQSPEKKSYGKTQNNVKRESSPRPKM